ncbi:MAG: bifunctional hydroxymethylpyrimidine kinase/phosphomethylpyrimidine kinase [Pseudomonadota bacterium]
MTRREPVALTIAGSDSSGGAGIQADLKTFAAHGVYGASVITALTAQNTIGVQAVHPVPTDFVVAQLKSVCDDLSVKAVKTGMLANAEIITALARAFANRPRGAQQDGVVDAAPSAQAVSDGYAVIVDPVMIATSGDPLINADAIAVMRDALVPVADLVTPNLGEAAALLETDTATSHPEMEEQGRAILKLGCGAVLIKGGHLRDDRAPYPRALDVLVTDEQALWLHAPFVETVNTHGTGCTLSAAIAAQIVLGAPLIDAVSNAKGYLTSALEAGRSLAVGAGHGPVDHVFETKLWSVG